MRKRRAFLMNSTVILLLIPLMLLLATYEDVSSQIIMSQSERTQVEKTYRVVSYVELDFQRTLEISGKRAIVTVVDYIANTRDFLDPNDPNGMANATIRDLVLFGQSTQVASNYSERLMKDQTVLGWLGNISQKLRQQGYELRIANKTLGEIRTMSSSERSNFLRSNIELTVAPLDAFRIVIRAKIRDVTISDVSGKVVYTGPIPRENYVYSTISIENLEDPIFSALTYGRYYRSIEPCEYTFPEIIERPIKTLYGNGTSEDDHVLGKYSSTAWDSGHIFYGNTYPGDGADGYVLRNGNITSISSPVIVNTTLNGVPISPLEVFNDDDVGVLIFENVSGEAERATWCSLLGNRLNVTIQNSRGDDLTNFQVPIYIDSSHITDPNTLNTFFDTADPDGNNIPILEIYDSNCNPVNFWVENWDTSDKEALIWVNVTIPANSQVTLSIYFDSSGIETLGNASRVFDFYDEFDGNSLDTTKWTTNTDYYSIENGYIKMWGNWNNQYYINTLKSFVPNVIIEGVWRLGGYTYYRGRNVYLYDTDLTIGLVPQQTTPWLSNSAIYAWYDGYDYDGYSWNYKSLRVYDSYPAVGNQIRSTEWQGFQVIYTGTQIQFWDSYSNSWLTSGVSPPLTRFHLQIAADTDSDTRHGYIDWIRVRKYTQIPPTVTISTQIEQRPTQNAQIQITAGRAYDLQPLISCIIDQKYFGTYTGVSFFERLENSRVNHNKYFQLAKSIQDELGLKYGGEYYPIGLVSFMVPNADYDRKLFDIFNNFGISVEEGQTSVDYYFLNYYFGSMTKTPGYRVWGISYGTSALTGDLSIVPFFMDNQTAIAILGPTGAEDLLKG
ncbi:DUF2341 domain-containing protein [Thermococcus radiotolerans]|uniref:DUF2341 domain-containing protein n=1 Tax=Thermococcus radiotolerans TaxID=187880 RepID=A0A2Z2N042_9EURY|nr:DUF2341 domain-containing protein [Thermococcus radiotolerans]ASJ15418.1 hypothetical protein A3L10_09865 [Thermococcus radiotolerans]